MESKNKDSNAGLPYCSALSAISVKNSGKYKLLMLSVNLLIQASFTLELSKKKRELRILLDKIKAWTARA